MTLEELEIVISANNQKFNTKIAQVQSRVDSMANHVNSKVDSMTNRVNSNLNKMSGTFNKVGKIVASAFAIGAISKFTKSCLELGSDLTEVQNVVDVTFGSMSDKVNEFAKNAWKTIGLSETMAKQYMGNFGAMAKSMGFTVESAEKMAETLTNLSGDVASFYNINQNEAYTKLKSVFTGETETLKELGVVMTQENLNQYALAKGYGKTTEKMNQQEKVALRLAYVTETLSAANNDFARTSNTWANQVRLLSLQYESFKASIGQGLIAVLTPVINVINTIMAKLVQMANTFNSVLSSIGFSISSGGGGNSFFGGATRGIDSSVDAMNDLSNATDGVGSSADKAKKKIEALMGIDEINKVNFSSDSGSGSGSGGSGGGVGTITSPSIDTSATENSLSAFNEKVNKILSELLSPLKKAWDNYGDWFLSKWDYFKRSFRYSCDELKKFLVSVWNHGGKEFVQHMAEIGIAVGGVALEIGGDILIALGNLWKHINPDNNPYTRKFIDTMNSLAIAVRDFIISAGSWFGKFLDLGGQAFINVIGDIVILVGTILAEVMRDAINIITAFMNSWVGSTLIGAVALTLDIVAGAIKAVLIVIEKCHVVLEAFLILWGAWKFSQVISGIGDTTTKLGGLIAKLTGLGSSLAINVIEFSKWIKDGLLMGVKACTKLGEALLSPVKTLKSFAESVYLGTLYMKDWIIAVGKNALKSLKSFGESVYVSILYLKDWITAIGQKAIASMASFLGSIGASIAGLLGLTTAEGAATAGATALNIALGALGIGVVIAAVAGLVVAVKEIGEKFGWWSAISNALSGVLEWVGEKVGWLWDKIKSFFGWDSEPAFNESIESIGYTAEETAQTTDDAFGTATSNVNKYLDSIHFNATRLAEEVDEATKAATEKFNMLSQNAQEYLDAIVNNDTERLAQMGENQSAYNEEVKAMYADLTEAEKNEFLKQYGIVQGINDDMLNYEGLTYDERVARHAAYLETIENNESLSYQEKKAKIDEANAYFQSSIDQEVAAHQESINSKKQQLEELTNKRGELTDREKELESELRKSIEIEQGKIDSLLNSSYDTRVTTASEANKEIKKVNNESTEAQAKSYAELTKTSDKAMKDINKSLKDSKKNVKDFVKESKDQADKLKKAFDGIDKKISGEFEKAKNNINRILQEIGNITTNTTKNLNDSWVSSLTNTANTIKYKLEEIKNIYQAHSSNVNSITVDLVNSVTSKISELNDSYKKSFDDVKSNISNTMDSTYNKVNNKLSDIKALFNSFSATLKVKIPHFYMYGRFNAETGQVPKVGVNYFARGGVVDRATLGVFGEAGKEAIVPLEHNTEWMDTLKGIMGAAFNEAMQSNTRSSNNYSDQPLNLTIQVGTTKLGKVVIDSINKAQRQAGRTLINI